MYLEIARSIADVDTKSKMGAAPICSLLPVIHERLTFEAQSSFAGISLPDCLARVFFTPVGRRFKTADPFLQA